MGKALFSAAIALGAVGAAAGAACAAGAKTLFDRTIPRQDTLRVDLNEMADMDKWEEYKKIITPNSEWLREQPLEHVSIKARDGIELCGNYFPAEGETDTIVICNHGYTSKGMSDCASMAVFFHKQMGYDCLIVDHRAHGESGGDYVGFGILDRYDCRAWINYIDERFEKKRRIILYGISMGATTVLMTAGFAALSKSVKAVIADCAFTSPYDVFSHVLKKDYHLPQHPIMDITNEMSRRKAGYGFSDYSTLEAVSSTTIPILFIHGREDSFVPTWMTEKNYEKCRSEKDMLIVDNAGHGASYYENPPLYEAKVKEFLEKYNK